MRIARKLALLAVMALAAMAMAATTASAAPIEVTNEATGVHCGAPGSENRCVVHVSGFSTLDVHVFGAEQRNVSSCTDEFEAEIYEDGSGHIYRYENNVAPSPACTRENCNGVGEPASESEWDFIANEAGPNDEELLVTLCLDTEGQENAAASDCSGLPVRVVHNASGHIEGFSAHDARGIISPAGVYCEVTGAWELENQDGHDRLVFSH